MDVINLRVLTFFWKFFKSQKGRFIHALLIFVKAAKSPISRFMTISKKGQISENKMPVIKKEHFFHKNISEKKTYLTRYSTPRNWISTLLQDDQCNSEQLTNWLIVGRWLMSDGLWVMSDGWWVRNEEWWVMGCQSVPTSVWT